MSRSSRSRAVLILLGTILAAGPAVAQDTPGALSGSRPAESKAAGQWTDPPAKAEKPATNAAAPKPMATPAKIDEPAVARRPEARAPRRMAKLRRAQIRTVASRTRPARVAVMREVDRPSRRVAARISAPPRFVRGPTARNLRPVYGFIPPDAPAEAYYEQRRFGTAGNRPSDLGLPAEDPAYRTVGMREGGRLVMRWRGPGGPAGVVVDPPSPLNPFGAE